MSVLKRLHSRRLRWLIIAAIAATLGWWIQRAAMPPPTVPRDTALSQRPEGQSAPVESASPPAAIAAESRATTPADTEDGAPEDHFSVTKNGELVLNERTRLGIEALVGIYTPPQLLTRLEALQATLPPAAYARLVDLVARYRNYLIASRQLYPPDAPRTDAGDALRELEDLHGLRATYLGADVARAFYADEEEITRHLLQNMAKDQTPGLTLQQKAERAQAAYPPPRPSSKP